MNPAPFDKPAAETIAHIKAHIVDVLLEMPLEKSVPIAYQIAEVWPEFKDA